MMALHPMLARQLRHFHLAADQTHDPERWAELLERVSHAYAEAEQDRYTLERSIEISTDEMRELYRDLAHKHETLLSGRQRLEAIFEHSAVGQALVDERGICSEANPALCAMLGVAKHELVGRELLDLIDVAQRADFAEPLREFLSGRRQELAAEQRWSTQKGEVLWVHVTLSLVQSNGALPRFASVFLQNVTERKRLEVELRHAQKLESVGRLAAGIAHEINTPVQFVGDNLPFLEEASQAGAQLRHRFRELLQRSVAEGQVQAAEIDEAEKTADVEFMDHEVPRAFAQMKDGLGRITTIVRAMKDFAHSQGTEHSSADLNRALASTIIVARSEYRLFAELRTEFGDIPPVVCSLSDLNQVFLNILVNAAHAIADVVKTTGNLGQIHVRTSVEGDWVLISISDSGTGIPEHVQAHMFEPFFTTKEVGRGTGQGLALARSVVVDGHHGKLTFRTRCGEGTTFEIRLRVPTDAQAPSLPASRLAAAMNSSQPGA